MECDLPDFAAVRQCFFRHSEPRCDLQIFQYDFNNLKSMFINLTKICFISMTNEAISATYL